MLTGVKVKKRDGRIELLDISKIQKYTSAACEGLKNVNQSELELDAKIQFRDGISTEEIQQTLIKTAVDKIDVDRPDWSFVAARLFLYDLYHKVSRWTGYNHLKEYFEKGEKEGRILLGLKEKYDLDELIDYIEPKRDLQFTHPLPDDNSWKHLLPHIRRSLLNANYHHITHSCGGILPCGGMHV
jgi:ribonucleoside-diphosphate reductase alpha chain